MAIVKEVFFLPTQPYLLYARFLHMRGLTKALAAHIIGPCRKKTCLWVFASSTGADQPAHLRSLISTFFIPFLESNTCKLSTGDISIH